MTDGNWRPVRYKDGMFLVGDELPRDGAWSEWLDIYGNIEVARFKFDIQDHFFPKPKILTEETIAAWRPLKEE